jgi:Tat protein secretion system quality control protein TatD with DNase activity
VARAVAQLRGATAENLAAATTRNAMKFFGLKEVEAPGAGS